MVVLLIGYIMAKAIIKTVSQIDKLFLNGDVYIYSVHLTDKVNSYILYLYDEHFKYVCECRNLTSFDIRMIRKIYTNLYHYDDEITELAKIFG